MGVFAEELRAGIAEAARKMTESLMAGDDYGVEVYCERILHLTHVAQRHGVRVSPVSEPNPRAAR
jgi:hypothetical protein